MNKPTLKAPQGPVVPDSIVRPPTAPTPPQHPDRTQSQPMVWQCSNVGCSEVKGVFGFDFISDQPKCPKCGAGQTDSPGVVLRSLIHLLVPDKNGPISGQYSRWRMLCSPKRDTLATPTNYEAATDNIFAVNCEGCLKMGHDLNIKTALGSPQAAQAFLQGTR